MYVKRIITDVLKTHKPLLLEVLLPAAGLILCFFLLVKGYFIFPASTIFAIILIPYVVVIRKTAGTSNRYLFVLLFFLVLAWITGLNTLIYIAMLAAVFFLIESNLGKTGILGFVYLIILSPIFMYIGNFVGVPARLELTELAGRMLNMIQMQNQVSGDLIITASDQFSVEPACMGLNMLSISFILAIVSAVHYERKYKKRIGLFAIACYLLIVFMLNLISNLIRIVLLIIFKIPAENTMHDVIGIICMIVYVLLPLWFLAQLFYRRFSKYYIESKPADKKYKRFILQGMAVAAFLTVIIVVKNRPQTPTFMPRHCMISGYEKSMTANDVIRFQNKDALIYVKPVRSFYGTEHTPMICWVGSGYTFEHVKKAICQSTEVFTGKLTKGEDSIYCSWWFDNGTHKTIRQTDWRWRVFHGDENYSLVNVNAASEKEMLAITEELLKKNIFK